SHITCPRCSGTGNIRSVESTALHVLRIVQEEAMKESTAAVHAQVPVAVASYLLNEKRDELYAIEHRVKVSCVLIPNSQLETPHYSVKRLRHDELNQLDTSIASYDLADEIVEEGQEKDKKQEVKKPSAAVKGVTPSQPPPSEKKQSGFFKRLIEALFGPSEVKVTNTSTNRRRNQRTDRRRGGRDDERNDRRRNRNDSRDRRRPRRGRGRDEESRTDSAPGAQSQQKEAAKDAKVTPVESRTENQAPTGTDADNRREGQNGRRRRRTNDRRGRNRRNDRDENTQSRDASSDESVNSVNNETPQQASQTRTPDSPAPQGNHGSSLDGQVKENTQDNVSPDAKMPSVNTEVAQKSPSKPRRPDTQHNEAISQPMNASTVDNALQPATKSVTKTAPTKAPIKEEPVVLPAGMTMIETASNSSGNGGVDSTNDSTARDQARDERRRRREAKGAPSGSQAEPLQQVETQGD
ncbi:MAG: hypothetical protein HOK99_01730, partial [Betaproteobacteria bacterium]|nr:hypothetical protein [Betaproteobacteria bacterium]